MFQIQNIVEPNRLRLIWQSSTSSDRTKYHVADIVRASQSYALYYRFTSDDFISAQKAGFRGHPAFDFRIPVHHENVLAIFMKRVPPRNRSDFWLYLQKNGLSLFPNVSDFALLGYAGARLPGDGFSLEIDFSIEHPPFQYFVEISGFRYYHGMQMDMGGMLGQPVMFVPEPTNPHDPNAVTVTLQGIKIGYVPRSQTQQIRRWLQTVWVSAGISRIEGPPLRPLVHLYLSVGSGPAPALGYSHQ